MDPDDETINPLTHDCEPVSLWRSSSPLWKTGTAFLLFRLYANDVDITSTDPALANWGWKQPPTISYKSSQGYVHTKGSGH